MLFLIQGTYTNASNNGSLDFDTVASVLKTYSQSLVEENIPAEHRSAIMGNLSRDWVRRLNPVQYEESLPKVTEELHHVELLYQQNHCPRNIQSSPCQGLILFRDILTNWSQHYKAIDK